MTDAEKQTAEVAFAVQDDWQRKGLGTYFFQRLVEIGREHGIHSLPRLRAGREQRHAEDLPPLGPGRRNRRPRATWCVLQCGYPRKPPQSSGRPPSRPSRSVGPPRPT